MTEKYSGDERRFFYIKSSGLYTHTHVSVYVCVCVSINMFLKVTWWFYMLKNYCLYALTSFTPTLLPHVLYSHHHKDITCPAVTVNSAYIFDTCETAAVNPWFTPCNLASFSLHTRTELWTQSHKISSWRASNLWFRRPCYRASPPIYLDMLKKLAFPELEEDKLKTFQQDGAPSYWSIIFFMTFSSGPFGHWKVK